MTKFQVNDKFVLSKLPNCFVLVGHVIEGDESIIKVGKYLKHNNKFFQIKDIGFLNAEGKNKYASTLVVEYNSEIDKNMLTNLVFSETIFEVVETFNKHGIYKMKIEGISYLKNLLIHYKEFTTIGKDGIKKYSFDWKLQYDDTNITVERYNLETMQIHIATVLIPYWNISIKIAKKIVKYNDLQGAVRFCFENLLVQNLKEI